MSQTAEGVLLQSWSVAENGGGSEIRSQEGLKQVLVRRSSQKGGATYRPLEAGLLQQDHQQPAIGWAGAREKLAQEIHGEVLLVSEMAVGDE